MGEQLQSGNDWEFPDQNQTLNLILATMKNPKQDKKWEMPTAKEKYLSLPRPPDPVSVSNRYEVSEYVSSYLCHKKILVYSSVSFLNIPYCISLFFSLSKIYLGIYFLSTLVNLILFGSHYCLWVYI